METKSYITLCTNLSISKKLAILKLTFYWDTGYPHDGRADKAAYPHDSHANYATYPHDCHADNATYPHYRHI